MTKFKLLSAGLIAAAALATPAMAREHHQKSWHDAKGVYVDASRVIYTNGHHCIRAPDVGAYASQPYNRPPCEPASWY
jgi:hypothetical protein